MVSMTKQDQNNNLAKECNHCYIFDIPVAYMEEQNWSLVWILARPTCGTQVSVIQWDKNIHI